jgi:hypothetical protein
LLWLFWEWGLLNYLPGLVLSLDPLFIFIYFCSTGVWTQGFTLARQSLYTWAMPPAWTLILLFSAFQVARITGLSHRCPAYSGYGWNKVLFYDWSGLDHEPPILYFLP